MSAPYLRKLSDNLRSFDYLGLLETKKHSVKGTIERSSYIYLFHPIRGFQVMTVFVMAHGASSSWGLASRWYLLLTRRTRKLSVKHSDRDGRWNWATNKEVLEQISQSAMTYSWQIFDQFDFVRNLFENSDEISDRETDKESIIRAELGYEIICWDEGSNIEHTLALLRRPCASQDSGLVFHCFRWWWHHTGVIVIIVQSRYQRHI